MGCREEEPGHDRVRPRDDNLKSFLFPAINLLMARALVAHLWHIENRWARNDMFLAARVK